MKILIWEGFLMQYAERYFKAIDNMINRVWENQREAMERAVRVMTETAASGKLIHIFGAGHTQILSLETWFRAGQPACISPIFDEGLFPHNGPQKGSALEKLEGYGKIIFMNHDVRSGEVIIVVSNSGRNPAPIEIALTAKERGLTVIGITSMDYTTRVASKHSSGKRLFEIADIVIDNGGPEGDAVIKLKGMEQKVGPSTTITNVLIVNALFVQMAADLHARGIEPPVFTSANLDVSLEKNDLLVERYKSRIKYYFG
jgi:uncharacterized phosphosugar-binding protein